MFTDTGDTETQESQSNTQQNATASETIPDDEYVDAVEQEVEEKGVHYYINPHMDDSQSLLRPPSQQLDDYEELEEDLEMKKASLESTMSKLLETENHKRILEFKVESYKADVGAKEKTISDLNVVILEKDDVISKQDKKIKDLEAVKDRSEAERSIYHGRNRDLEAENKRLKSEVTLWKKSGLDYLKGSDRDNATKIAELTKKVGDLTKLQNDMKIARDKALVQAKENREIAWNYRTQLLQEQGAHAKTKRMIQCTNKDCSGDNKSCPFGHKNNKNPASLTKINRQCRFFNPYTGSGCRDGEDCRFLHEKKNESVADIFEESTSGERKKDEVMKKEREVEKKEKKTEKKKDGIRKKKKEVVLVESDDDKMDVDSVINKDQLGGAGPGTSRQVDQPKIKVDPASPIPPPANFNPEDYLACKEFQNKFMSRPDVKVKNSPSQSPIMSSSLTPRPERSETPAPSTSSGCLPTTAQVEAYFRHHAGSATASTVPIPRDTQSPQTPIFQIHPHPPAPTIPVIISSQPQASHNLRK